MLILKKIKYSALFLSIVLSTLSCTAPIIQDEGKILLHQSQDKIIKVSSENGSSVIVNIKTLNKNFSVKDTKNGNISSTTPFKIRIVMSLDPLDPYNNPVNMNTSFLINSFPTNVKFDNLLPNKTYYLACKAFSANTENESTNITEGGTFYTNEYIQVNSSGIVNIQNDVGTLGQIDMLIPLKNASGARVDINTNFINGKMTDFMDKDSLIDKVVSTDLIMPDVDISDNGDGAIVWKERIGSGTQKIKLSSIVDYVINGNSLDITSVNDNLNKPSISLNSSNNGLLCNDYKLTNPEISIYPISNLNTIGSVNSLGINYNNCDIQIKNSIPSDSGLIVFTDVNSGGVIKARSFKSSNNFNSVNFTNDMSSSDTIISLNTLNQNANISRITKTNNALVVWQSNNGGYGIKARKVKINNSSTPPTISTPSPECDEYVIDFDTSNQLLKPTVSIDENGNGFVAWEKSSNIYYRKIYDFKAQGSTKQISNPLTNNQSNPKIIINNKGNGLITWTESQDIFGINIYHYDVFESPFKIDDGVSSIQDSSALDIDEKGYGYIGWTDDRDEPGVKAIYGKRIIDYYPN